jgi:hypothetical protein
MLSNQCIEHLQADRNPEPAQAVLQVFLSVTSMLRLPRAIPKLKEEIPRCRYYTKDEWTKAFNRKDDAPIKPDEDSQSPPRRYQFLENVDGTTIKRHIYAGIMDEVHLVLNTLKDFRVLKSSWTKMSHIWTHALANHLCSLFDIFTFGNNCWKVNQFMSLVYPDYARPLKAEGFWQSDNSNTKLTSRSPSPGVSASDGPDSLNRSPSPFSASLQVPSMDAKTSATGNRQGQKKLMKSKPKKNTAGTTSQSVADDPLQPPQTMDVDSNPIQVRVIPASSSPPHSPSISPNDVCVGQQNGVPAASSTGISP